MRWNGRANRSGHRTTECMQIDLNHAFPPRKAAEFYWSNYRFDAFVDHPHDDERNAAENGCKPKPNDPTTVYTVVQPIRPNLMKKKRLSLRSGAECKFGHGQSPKATLPLIRSTSHSKKRKKSAELRKNRSAIYLIGWNQITNMTSANLF